MKLSPAGGAPFSAKLSTALASTSVADTEPVTTGASSATEKAAPTASGASLVPFTVTMTVRVVPSAVVMVKLSVTEAVAGSACTFAAALFSEYDQAPDEVSEKLP